MKILQLHSDWIEYEPVKKEIVQAEDVEKKPYRHENILVLLTAVEKGDNEEVGERAIDEVSEFMKSLHANKVLVYPYAHLSKELAKPQEALFVIKQMEKHAKKLNLDVYRAPFGWTKRFAISVKGHPLAEQSKSFTKDDLGQVKKAEKRAEKPAKAEEPKELSDNDHRLLGKKLDLFSFQTEAPGMVFYHAKGMMLRNRLIEFWREEHGKAGYQEISTPSLMNKNIWETSGHWDHYKDNMFFTSIEDMDFAMKPMNCPGAILVFKSSTRSYRELPLRLAELGTVHRNELSGVLSGLFRMRVFTQDDAHIFVGEDKLEEEIERVVDIVDYFYKAFGFDYHVELSTRPDNAMGSKEVWDKAEGALESALKKRKMKYKINPKEGAFYGPKIDFHIKDSLGRTWQCATVQVDFMMPERFDISYNGEDNKPHRPVIIHRVIYGSLERFIGILVEHYSGAFPLWLSPVQVRVLALTDKNNDTAEKVLQQLKEKGIRADTDTRSSTVEYRVREAEMQKVNYILVIGEKEEKNKTVAVRRRGKKEIQFGVKLEDFVKQLKDELEKKR
ncbi:MAG: threonine--tRNA ligase [Candidatus Aenigmarchaeota archaeon]|nr:threonine--tRNA ligase [Candidatus Aenigmarchaeota archaeon]